MKSSLVRARYGRWLVTGVLLMSTSPLWAQVSATLNGRVFDQSGGVLPGATVSAINTNTGVTRSTATNADGVFSLPGLDPGVYNVTAELSGFAPATRPHVTLAVNTTLSFDFRLVIVGLTETITVTSTAPMIEATQSKVAAAIERREIENLPMVTRNFSGLVTLLPGAKPLAYSTTVPNKMTIGSVSFGGSALGRTGTLLVDGAETRDLVFGGPLMSLTQEGIDQFQVATHQMSAADGRAGGGAVVTVVTKSGTNELHGSGFLFDRTRSLIAKDYFTSRGHLQKPDFSRQQYGGSVGGPIVKNRIFFFGAFEGINQDTSVTVPESVYNQLLLLEPLGANPVHAIPQPFWNVMYSGKGDANLGPGHLLSGRFSVQRWSQDNAQLTERGDFSQPQVQRVESWNAVAQYGWVFSNRGLNQLIVSGTKYRSSSDSLVGGQFYYANFPNVARPPVTSNLIFPTVKMGYDRGGGLEFIQTVVHVRDDATLQLGTHALKIGAAYSSYPTVGSSSASFQFGSLTFFDDPSVIFSNSNGRYPQGIQTPGIVRLWTQSTPTTFTNGRVKGMQQVQAWFQDDWRATPRLTLNLGLRYDLDLNFFGQRQYKQSLTQQVLAAIGSPYAGFPQTPTKDISPRVGFAYDLSGEGRRVVRGGYGLYFDWCLQQYASFAVQQMYRPIAVSASLVNTAIGVGQLATYRYGIDEPPPPPGGRETLPNGATGQWFDPGLGDPYYHQAHIGYSHELSPRTVLSVDFTHVTGRHDIRALEINPMVNGVRVLAPALASAIGNANQLGAVKIQAAVNRSRYDALTFQFQRRFPHATLQAHYTLSGAFTYGSSGGTLQSQNQFDIFGPGEWGPTEADERHRVVAFGVLDLRYGIQLSPVLQWASARPYTLIAGTDLNRDGTVNDRYVDPATGQQMAVNSERGDRTTLLDLRATKFFTFGANRRLGVFAEVFNVFNTANFGNSYNGNALAVTFKQPIGFIPGIGYQRQLQLGARFLF